MDFRSVRDSLCTQLSDQAGKDVNFLWDCDLDVHGTLVWLNGSQLHDGTRGDGSHRKRIMKQLYLVNEVADDTLMLAPVFRHAGVAGGTRFLRRADAEKLQLAQADDLYVLAMSCRKHLIHTHCLDHTAAYGPWSLAAITISERPRVSSSGDRISEVMFIWLVSRLRNEDSQWAPKGLRSRWAHESSSEKMYFKSLPADKLRLLPHERTNKPKYQRTASLTGNFSSQQPAACTTSQHVHEAGRSAPDIEYADGSKTAAPRVDVHSTKHTKSIKLTSQVNSDPCNMPRCKTTRVPNAISNTKKKMPNSNKRRINADKRRMRDQMAKVHERKEQQKQSFLNLPQENTAAADVPYMRQTAKQ